MRIIESADNARREYVFSNKGTLQAHMLKDTRPLQKKLVDSFLDQFFPVGYPQSVAEGYLEYSQFRVLQHFSSAILSVLSTQSLIFAAGLRPSPAQATVVSWVLKDGMQHIGKLFGSRLGVRMDSDPKRWRILADALYDLGTALEIVSPVCPQYFLGVAGIANLAKGVALVTARATRVPIYSAFAKEGNLSDLYAKGEAMSTLANVFGLGVGIRLAASTCVSLQRKLMIAPILAAIHLYSVVEQMRATPINTLNPQRTAMLVADYLKTGIVSSPAELRYRERLILPVANAGNVKVGTSLHSSLQPSEFVELRKKYKDERFLLKFWDSSADLVLHRSAKGEDVVRGWLLAACTLRLATCSDSDSCIDKAYGEMERLLPDLLTGLKQHGWQTQLFLAGSVTRAVW